MAPRVRAFARSQVRERTQSFLKYFEATMTIAVEGMDVDVGFLVHLRIVEEDCMIVLVLRGAGWGVDGQAFLNDGQGGF